MASASGSGLRELGGTGRQVSSLGLGLAALGRPGYLNLGHGKDLAAVEDLAGETTREAMQGHALEMLDDAWAAGVRYFDAARSYGAAESFLASWLTARGFSLDALRPTIGSKWGYAYVADWQTEADVHEVKDLGATQLDRQYHETSALLDDFLDLYQIHSATIDSGVLDDSAVADRLRDVKADGTAIGLSTTGPEQGDTIRRALEVTVDGEPLFDTVQSTWNLLEPSAGPALADAASAGLGVIVKETVANGRLAGRDPTVAFRLGQLADGVAFDQLAMAASLAQPWATVTLSGATTVPQLRSNLKARSPETVALAADIAATGELSEEPKEYWSRRADLNWN